MVGCFPNSYPSVVFHALVGYWGQFDSGVSTERRHVLGEKDEFGSE